MCSIKNIAQVCFFLLYTVLRGQDDLTGYLEPSIALNYDVAVNYSHNFKIAQRSYLYDQNLEFRGRQLDVSHFSNLKIRDDQSIAFGVQFRFRNLFESDKENELRLTQQYNLKIRKNTVRFGNRFRSEQRITSSLTTHRFRYRFAIDLPLNGEKLDIGEAYFVVSTESLMSIAKGKSPEYDQRLTSNIGWLISQIAKLQIGFEYRAENYNNTTESVAFFRTALIFSI